MDVNPENLRIVRYPADVLRRKGEPVETVDEQVRAVAERMIRLMHEAGGVGLAAPQVGLSWRMFVANPTGETDADTMFINPRFTELAEQAEADTEGCLSIPNVEVEVRRPVSVTVEATGPDGERFSRRAEGLAARVLQHEADHLDGVLILDKMTPMDRMANRKALRQLEAESAGT